MIKRPNAIINDLSNSSPYGMGDAFSRRVTSGAPPNSRYYESVIAKFNDDIYNQFMKLEEDDFKELKFKYMSTYMSEYMVLKPSDIVIKLDSGSDVASISDIMWQDEVKSRNPEPYQLTLFD
jgi:hypothetical protein